MVNPQHLSFLSLEGEESFKPRFRFGFSVLDRQRSRAGGGSRSSASRVVATSADDAQSYLYEPQLLRLRRDLLRLPNARGLSPSYYLPHFPTVGPVVRGFNGRYIRRVKSHKG
ncbi:hypothetical protein PanWU01x14_125990 [Parasponia andersonii]|uniref:Uncharacterized protein n=1 Tax=Parasponia andersonii TaxID=3476 RepID=A0A2P5CTA4_PARAD|nr:hypothetical protein PanWU01x14_125990 [Parasponia andersonii]